MPSNPTIRADLADRLEDLLPQTQCTKCGYPACRPYADAMAGGEAEYNRCPPGGSEGIARLAALLGRARLPLDPERGVEKPRAVAIIDESVCIGCTLCIQACPVDAIVGAAKQMHTVLPDWCTGCDLCVAPCPVDCIRMEEVSGSRTGWEAWSQEQADAARARHDFRKHRLLREKEENDARLAAKAAAKLKALEAESAGSAAVQAEQARKKAIIEAAIQRALARQAKQSRPHTAETSESENADAARVNDGGKHSSMQGKE